MPRGKIDEKDERPLGCPLVGLVKKDGSRSENAVCASCLMQSKCKFY